jgi:putative transcriptional regulator
MLLFLFKSVMTKKANSVVEAILEMADDQLRSGLMDKAEHEKITIRHMGDRGLGLSRPISGEEIRIMREQAHMSQAAFARVLNLTVGYVSQLERGVRKPTGPALSLLNIIRRKGVEAILVDDVADSKHGVAA